MILDKSKAFALRMIKLYKYLQKEKKEFVISKQIVRSGMSIGANAKEASLAQSKPAFIAKMNIALGECGETEYWLELLYEKGIIVIKIKHTRLNPNVHCSLYIVH